MFSLRKRARLLAGCALCAALTVPAVSQNRLPKRPAPDGTKAAKPPVTPSAAKYKPDDVMATVEGQTITRRELVTTWLQLDNRANAQLGSLLSDRWKASKGALAAYTISESDIYQALFSDPAHPYLNILSNIVTMRLVAIEAARKGIIVTRTQAQKYAHELFDQVRAARGMQMDDEKLMDALRVPRELFMEDVLYRLRAERLFAADIARRNGHPLSAEDWVVVRELYTAARTENDTQDNETLFARARERLEEHLNRIKQGQRMEDVARQVNENFTRAYGGLRSPALRGTGARALEEAIWKLKPGETSLPQRGRNGWYVFRLERRGSDIPEEERAQRWKMIVEQLLPDFLLTLRKNAKITSIIPLPNDALPPNTLQSIGDSNDMPPPPPRVRF